MKNNLTELIFILDRSGSMSGLELDTIGGFNSLIEKQKKEAGDAIITTVLFDNEYELLHDRINLNGITPITDKEYYVRGCTALLDAIGKTLNKIISVKKHTCEEERAAKVMFVIITDGIENASKEYSYSKVKTLIETQKSKYGWEFLFLGANIDAVDTASKFGISEDKAANYHADSVGTMVNYEAINGAMSNLRKGKKLNSSWKRNIEKDYDSRNKQ